MLMFTASALAACVVGAAPMTAAEDTHDEAVALARAMLANDEGIFSIEWGAEAWMKRPDGQWEKLQSAEHGLDERGRWYMHALVGSREKPGDPVAFARDDRWTSDGIVQTWTQQGGDHAVKVWVDPLPFSYPNVMLFLGRMCSGDGQLKLGEVLLQGEDLRVVKPENADGVLRIAATWRGNEPARDFLVDVDSHHGFMPVRIEVRERMRDARFEVMEVTEIKEVNGVFLPVAGERWTYATAPPPKDKEDAFERALRDAGFDFRNRAFTGSRDEVEKYRSVVRQVFGPEGFPVQQMPSGDQRLSNVKVHSVNTPIADTKFTPDLPQGMPTADCRWDDPVVAVDNGDGTLQLEPAAAYQRLEFHLAPPVIQLRGICGEPISGEVRIAGIDAAKVLVRNAACTTPGVVIDRFVARNDDPSIQTILFSATPAEPGVWSGSLRLDMKSSVQPSVTTPLTVRALSAWRAEPAGVVLHADGAAGEVDVKLVRRSVAAAAPATVTLDHPLEGVKVELTPAHELRVTRAGDAHAARTTSAVARVLDDAGHVCAVVPVIWYSPAR